MAGKIKKALDEIIFQRSKGDPTLASITRTKLYLKGINLELYKDDSPDDLVVIEKIRHIAEEFSIKLTI
jgi:hypothetical protein